ncbi:MAG: TetR/AcrR family transcriptional regulator [Desulfobacterota bacterium]|nr:TetR/AcrR family transcriptional regulator [Thermodesulfobacteriota bacterium]
MSTGRRRFRSFPLNRARILKAATALFARRGFEGTSVRDIAEKAGISVPGMFYYFPTKERILFEIMTSFMDEAYQKIMEIYCSEIDPVEKLRRVCKFYVEQYAGHKQELTLLATEIKGLNPEHQQICIEKERDYVKALKSLFRDLADRNLLKPINPSILAFIFFGMVHWTYQWYNPKAKKGISPNELGNIFSEVFLSGILLQGSGQVSSRPGG